MATQVKFLRIGGLNRSERVGKLNRLIEIESFLSENNMLVDTKDPSREIKFTAGLDIPEDYMISIKLQEETGKKTVKQNKIAE